MKVVMTEEAQRQARAERAWWRANRDAKSLFSDELRAVRSRLARVHIHEIYGSFDGQPVRRILLEKTRCHVYYIIDEAAQLVRIVAVWGAMKHSGPGTIKPR